MRHLANSREEQMAALHSYIRLLENCGHNVRLKTISVVEMKSIGVKAAQFIFEQGKKSRGIPREEGFKMEMVDLTDNTDEKKYYGGFFSFQELRHPFAILLPERTKNDNCRCWSFPGWRSSILWHNF